MPDLHSQIYSLALDAFLLIGAVKLTIELLIPLVMLAKKLIATIKSDYVLASETLEQRTLANSVRSRDATKLLIAELRKLDASSQFEVIRTVWPELARKNRPSVLREPSVPAGESEFDRRDIWPEIKARLERASRQ